jgi:hypothetical protein
MKKQNRYEKILARPDKRRPSFVKELNADPFLKQDGLVLSIHVLHPSGATTKVTWSEKMADEMLARKQLK